MFNVINVKKCFLIGVLHLFKNCNKFGRTCFISTKVHLNDVYNVYNKAAITANCQQCALIGRQIMEQGGSLADVAIATLVCGGVRNPERMGPGGGFVMTLYHRAARRVEVLIARERAPAAATPDMFNRPQNEDNPRSSLFGGLASAVPGSLLGLWELHRRYGRLPWSRLLEPAVTLCRDGLNVEPFTRYGLLQLEQNILRSSSMRQILVDPFSGEVKTEKQKIYRTTLSRTLEQVAESGPGVLYDGQLTENFVKDIRDEGGIMIADDMKNYRVKWLEPVSVRLPGELTAFAPPPPSCGPALLCILHALATNPPNPNESIVARWHRIIETWKFAYGFRTRLGDPDHIPAINDLVTEMLSSTTAKHLQAAGHAEKTTNDAKHYGGEFETPADEGTAHFNFINEEGDAIAVTETINTLFGAMFRSESTGIILNNTMDDFSIPGARNVFDVPPTTANSIAPGKMPLTSMVPTIITDDASGDVRMIVGGAGGTKIVSAVSLVALNHLWWNKDLQEAVNTPRLHHQLMPMELEYEPEFSREVIHKLWTRGHRVVRMRRRAVVGVISRLPNGELHAKGDPRRHCANTGF